MSFDRLLEDLEGSSKILDFRFENSDIPMYLIIRSLLLQTIINKDFNLSSSHVDKKKSFIGILKYIFYTIKSNLFLAPKKDVIIFSSGIVNVVEDGKYINRLYDSFNSLYPEKTQIIESSTKMSYLLPKKEKIYFKDLIDILIILGSKFIRIKRNDRLNIDKLIEYIKNSPNINCDELTYEGLKTMLLKMSKQLNLAIYLYKFFLKMKKPKIIILENAHYGGRYIPLIIAAKELGIKTAEYQHGYVGLTHYAYNYAQNIFNFIEQYLPEYLLTHGKYWSDRIRTPSHKIEIGLPSLSLRINNLQISNTDSKRILFISGGTVYQQLNQFIELIVDDLTILGYELILRPHPSEMPMFEQRYGNLIQKGVVLDTKALYETLKNMPIVVGMEISTVLFEAVCFTNRVYLVDNDYTRFCEPKIGFLTFANKNDLIESIKKDYSMGIDVNYFWDSNWKENYKNFIEKIIGISNAK